MSSLRAVYYLWKAYEIYWIGSSGIQYYQTARQCYSLTHPVVRWCYQKIYQKNPDSWNNELRAREYLLLAELDAVQTESTTTTTTIHGGGRGNRNKKVVKELETRKGGESEWEFI